MDEAIWGGFVAAAPSISFREKPIRLLGCSYSLNLAMLRIRRPVIVRAHMQRLQFRWLKHQLQIKYDV